MPTVRDLVFAIDAQYPLARAESWDRVGLQIGDENATVKRVLVAHEMTHAVLDEAIGCDALVVYHPPIFRALENLDFKNHTVKLASRCIAQGLHVVAAHTALDNANPPYALGDALAQQLEFKNVEVLKPSGRESLWKIVVFVPDEALAKVREALWQAGAGEIGNYDRASFRSRGIGTFRPREGANPQTGHIGRDETVEEWRLECIVSQIKRDAAVRAMIQAHPYESVAHDIYPLHNSLSPFGAARLGKIAATPLDIFASKLGVLLGAPNVRIVRAGKHVSRVACVPGSGASFIGAAARAGCDCLISGDFKHHDALQALALGLSLIDVTHVATERAAIAMLAQALENLDVKIVHSAIDTNPLVAVKP